MIIQIDKIHSFMVGATNNSEKAIIMNWEHECRKGNEFTIVPLIDKNQDFVEFALVKRRN